MVAAQDPKGPTRSPPKMEQFREQIDLYEGLYLEIEEMEPSKVFCGWFRVNLRPFRQSVLNMVCKWSSMFKRHLVDRVTSSLSDLGSFIRCFLLRVTILCTSKRRTISTVRRSIAMPAIAIFVARSIISGYSRTWLLLFVSIDRTSFLRSHVEGTSGFRIFLKLRNFPKE